MYFCMDLCKFSLRLKAAAVKTYNGVKILFFKM